MTFTKRPGQLDSLNISICGEVIEMVSQFKYLGNIMDSNLTFEKHVKKVVNTVKFNLQNFTQIRPFISTVAAKSYLHCMILSHIEYCFTIWSFAGATVLNPIAQLYKKPSRYLPKCHIQLITVKFY